MGVAAAMAQLLAGSGQPPPPPPPPPRVPIVVRPPPHMIASQAGQGVLVRPPAGGIAPIVPLPPGLAAAAAALGSVLNMNGLQQMIPSSTAPAIASAATALGVATTAPQPPGPLAAFSPSLQLVQPPPPPSGVPPGFVEQLKVQMSQMAGTSDKLCNYSRSCRSVSCPNTHPDGRDIEDDPHSVICRFSRRCKRSNCFYVHPAGRDLDEDPSKGKCKLGEDCLNPACIYTHPETRKAITQLTCFSCGARGHVARDCPKDPRAWQPRVAVKGFPEEWSRDGFETLVQRVAQELEVFGQLTGPPEVQGLGDQVFATFEDVELAKQAIQALNGEVFDMDFCSPPPPPRSQGGTVVKDKRCTIFVGNLPLDSTEEELREIFSRVGVVESFRVVLDRDTKKSKGYGFCDYSHPDLAQDALKYLADVEVGGRRLRLCPAAESLGSRGSGRPSEGGAEAGGSRCEMQIQGFPARWTSAELREFLLCAIKVKPSLLNIEMEPPSGDPLSGFAIVAFANESDAKGARQDLEGQKIAGKPLSVNLAGVMEEEDQGADWAADKARWWGKDDKSKWWDRDGKDDKGQWWDKDDKEWRRSRSRSRSGGVQRRRRKDEWSSWARKDGRVQTREAVMTTVFIDELSMPLRAFVEPCQEDCEVWVDRLPGEDGFQDWSNAFGEVEDLFRVPDPSGSQPSGRGYVKFKGHSAAARCVDQGAGRWSESERWLSSQQQARRGDRSSVYPENMISKILGTRGDVIAGLRDEVGAKALMLRGEGLGDNDKMESSRVHFVCKSALEALPKLHPALERAIEKIHSEVQNKGVSGGARGRRGERPSKDLLRESVPWRPPGNEPPPPPHWIYPPPGNAPPGPPGWYPHWGPPGHHPYPPPWIGPPGLGGPLAAGHFSPGPLDMDPPPGHFGCPSALDEAIAAEAGGRGGRRRRRPEEDAEGEAAVRGRRRRRRAASGEPAATPTEGRREGPPMEPGMPARQAEALPALPAEVGSAVAGTFLERLPASLTPEEQALGEAVVEFLRVWGGGDAAPPNMVHLGGDVRVREFKAAALPREVSLKAWLKQRFNDRVEVRGQSVVALE